MSVVDERKHWWNDSDKGKLKYTERNLSQCCFICHFISHIDKTWKWMQASVVGGHIRALSCNNFAVLFTEVPGTRSVTFLCQITDLQCSRHLLLIGNTDKWSNEMNHSGGFYRAHNNPSNILLPIVRSSLIATLPFRNMSTMISLPSLHNLYYIKYYTHM
jgi:hypothetical protein